MVDCIKSLDKVNKDCVDSSPCFTVDFLLVLLEQGIFTTGSTCVGRYHPSVDYNVYARNLPRTKVVRTVRVVSTVDCTLHYA